MSVPPLTLNGFNLAISGGFMKLKAVVALMILSLSGVALPQSNTQKSDDQTIRISTELVQLDVVVTDKKGKVVSNLKKEDFELYENGKKQQVNFFEFIAGGLRPGAGKSGGEVADKATAPEISSQGPGIGDVRRIFAFVIDDLTIRHEDLNYIRQMLGNFVETRMQPSDLVAIVRSVGGKGLLQQFTTDKDLLRRAIAALTPKTHPFANFNNPDAPRLPNNPTALMAGGGGANPVGAGIETSAPFDISTNELADTNVAPDDSNKTLRAFMSLGTASFVIDSMKQLPGRKALVLVSGGMPFLSSRPGSEASNITYFLNALSDNATRAGVTIHTMDIRGLEAQRAVASFEDTPGKSMVGMQGSTAAGASGAGFGRTADEGMLGKNPIESHQSLRMLASATGGLAILNRNNFDEGLGDILSVSEGYYLLAYTPSEGKFDSKFREVKIKVKGSDYKVYSRRGYFARESKTAATPATKQEQILAAVRSPLARRDIDLDATLLYKAAPPDQGTIDIHLIIDPKKLQFDQVGDKSEANLDVAGFVFDELGKLRGGFSETINAQLTSEELAKVGKGGLTYSANTMLPAGSYQVRIAVRDNKTNSLGTMSRYLEVPDLSKGRLAASSLLLASVAPGDMKATNPTPVSANRQIPRSQDVRYAVIIYNAKLKDGKPQMRTQLAISQGGKIIFKEDEQDVAATGSGGQLIKWGQLGLSSVKAGRYTLTLIITDRLADKNANVITRSMDFVVVN
jgi:VWFA-related protein